MQAIEIPGYIRAPFNSQLCLYNNCNNRDLQRINVDLRTMILQEKSFYIPRGSRVCEEHSGIMWHDIETNTRRTSSTFSPAMIKDIMDILKKCKPFLDFKNLQSIHDTVFRYYIGFSKQQFNEILQSAPNITRRHKKNAARALALVLAKLHTGESNERLSTVFRMTRKTFEKTMKLVRADLLAEFVPLHLGFNHLTRNEVISRCLSIPNALYGNPEAPLPERRAIIILDGTYIYIQKSSNYHFQRKSYSLHKFRQLVKPFLLVCPDGHIIDIYGLYAATKSDATILKEIMRNESDPFHWFFNQGDVLILDRGFRDSIEDIDSCGYLSYMPASKNDTELQLSTFQANESRKVSMCRWVVETINGRLKNQFRLLRSQYFNVATPHLFEEIKIAAALLNAFGVPLTDHYLVNEILNQIRLREGQHNRISDYVISNNINRRRAHFEMIDAAVPGMDEFPVLSADDLIVYAMGTYQVQQARSYYGEHIKNGCYLIEVYKEPNIEHFNNENPEYISPWLLRGRIQSRHVSSRTYYVYILIERELQGRDAIVGHYCSCIVGKRTLGCCSHVMSVIWYLGYGKYQPNVSPPAQFLEFIVRHDIGNEANEADDPH